MQIAFVCRNCKGPPLPQPPLGACPNCFGFYRHEQVRLREDAVDGAAMEQIRDGEPIGADALMAGEDEIDAALRPTNSPGVDWMFGGGLPRVGTILFAAREGSGKSTFLWQLSMRLAAAKVKCLYESSEQSLQGLRRQFKRLGPPPLGMVVHCSEDRYSLLRAIEKEQPEFLVLDSLHHVINVTDEGEYDVAAGSSRAVTIIAKEIGKLAEDMGMLAFLVGHMNNDGTMRGGADLRHTVDATLTLWRPDDKNDPHRRLEFGGKTRFGRADRRASFVMNQDGLNDLGPIYDETDNQPPQPPTAPPPLRLVPRG